MAHMTPDQEKRVQEHIAEALAPVLAKLAQVAGEPTVEELKAFDDGIPDDDNQENPDDDDSGAVATLTV